MTLDNIIALHVQGISLVDRSWPRPDVETFMDERERLHKEFKAAIIAHFKGLVPDKKVCECGQNECPANENDYRLGFCDAIDATLAAFNQEGTP